MKFYCLGSINIDHVYQCNAIINAGETLVTREYEKFIGGKGLNQAFALFKAGIRDVSYCGVVGRDGKWMVDELLKTGFPTGNIVILENQDNTGHVVIQKNPDGDDAVILHNGTNHMLTKEMIVNFLADSTLDDVFLIQCETNLVAYAINYAKRERGMKVIFNAAPLPPSPWTSDIYGCDWIIINKREANDLFRSSLDNTNCHYNVKQSFPQSAIKEEEEIDKEFLNKLLCFTKADNIIVTMGDKGCRALVKGVYHTCPSIRPPKAIIDTTGAGDVFLAYFITCYLKCNDHNDVDLKDALQHASMAAALCITKMGALVSIPDFEQVKDYYETFLIASS